MTEPTRTLPEPYQIGRLKPCPFCGKPIVKEDRRTYSCRPCGYALIMDIWILNGKRVVRNCDAIWNQRVKE